MTAVPRVDLCKTYRQGEVEVTGLDGVDDALPEPGAHLGVEAAGGAPPPKPPRNNYTLQRRIMLALKKDIHSRPHGKLVKRVKYYCDVLLRE